MDWYHAQLHAELTTLVLKFVNSVHLDSGAEPSLSVRQRAQDELIDLITRIGDES